MLIAQKSTVGQIKCIFDDNYSILFFIISHSYDSNEHYKLKFLWRTDQSCVLFIINIHTFSCLLYRKSTVFCMRNIVIEK